MIEKGQVKADPEKVKAIREGPAAQVIRLCKLL